MEGRRSRAEVHAPARDRLVDVSRRYVNGSGSNVVVVVVVGGGGVGAVDDGDVVLVGHSTP